MSWRDAVSRRRRREEVQYRDVPPRFRPSWFDRDAWSSAQAWATVVFAAGVVVYGCWEGQYLFAGIFGGMCGAAGAFAWWNARAHRSRRAGDLRAKPEPEPTTMEWEPDER